MLGVQTCARTSAATIWGCADSRQSRGQSWHGVCTQGQDGAEYSSEDMTVFQRLSKASVVSLNFGRVRAKSGRCWLEIWIMAGPSLAEVGRNRSRDGRTLSKFGRNSPDLGRCPAGSDRQSCSKAVVPGAKFCRSWPTPTFTDFYSTLAAFVRIGADWSIPGQLWPDLIEIWPTSLGVGAELAFRLLGWPKFGRHRGRLGRSRLQFARFRAMVGRVLSMSGQLCPKSGQLWSTSGQIPSKCWSIPGQCFQAQLGRNRRSRSKSVQILPKSAQIWPTSVDVEQHLVELGARLAPLRASARERVALVLSREPRTGSAGGVPERPRGRGAQSARPPSRAGGGQPLGDGAHLGVDGDVGDRLRVPRGARRGLRGDLHADAAAADGLRGGAP